MNKCMQNDDYDKVIRNLIEKETDIVDTRIRWSFLMHSVLLTAYWKVAESANENKIIYISILTIVGVCFSISSLYTVWSSERAIAFILSKWNNYIHNNGYSYDDFPPVWAGSIETINNCIDVKSERKKKRYKNIYFHMGGMSMYKVIPRSFLFVWFAIFINCLCQCLHIHF